MPSIKVVNEPPPQERKPVLRDTPRDNPGPARLECRRALVAIARYCNGASTHSALSTVAMLIDDAIEAYDAEQLAIAEVLTKHGR